MATIEHPNPAMDFLSQAYASRAAREAEMFDAICRAYAAQFEIDLLAYQFSLAEYKREIDKGEQAKKESQHGNN